MKKKIFIAGGVSIDSIIYLPEFPQPRPQTIHECRFSETLGSTGSGKALNLCRLGFEVTLHALIGDDIWGRQAIEELQHPNLRFIYDIDPNGTERHTNIMNEAGQRISVFTNNVDENPDLDYNKFIPMIQDADIIVVNLAGYTKKLLPLVKACGKEIWTDLHDYDDVNPWHNEFIEWSDYVLMSSDNLPDYEPFMHKMMEREKKLVVVTHGSKGSSGSDKTSGLINIPAMKVEKPTDTNGAGDAYFSGFLYSHAAGFSLKECMQAGSIAGGMCVQSARLFNSELSATELEKQRTLFYY